MEVMVALVVTIMTASLAFWGYSQANSLAFSSRLYTSGQMLVQNQIDLIQGDTPFIPQLSKIPTELTLGTATQSVTVYSDPQNSTAPIVTGTITTTVSNISNASSNEYAYQAVVQLQYQYRNTTYNIALSTIRGSDQ